MAWKIHEGTAKASLWPEPSKDGVWTPDEDEENELLEIDGVAEVSSSHAQSTKIIVEADSVSELPALVARVKPLALEIIRKYSQRGRKGW